MARLDPATYPDRLVFERHARRVRREELDALFTYAQHAAAPLLHRLLELLHLPAMERVRSRPHF